jgi:hypothetical protein
MLLGKRVLGAELAASEALKETGGAVVAVRLGPRVLAQGAPIATPAAEKPRPRAVRSANRVTPPKPPAVADEAPAPKKPAPSKDDLGYSEGQVEDMLAKDANMWDVVLDAEAVRPEGPRAAVAAMLLSAAERATEKPIPDKLVAYLETLIPKAN